MTKKEMMLGVIGGLVIIGLVLVFMFTVEQTLISAFALTTK